MSALSAAAQDEDGDIISALRARVADLEAQLYAVGAGGVGKLEQPQSVTNCHQSQPQGEPPGSTESAYQRGYLDGMAKGRRDAAMDAEEGQEPVTARHRFRNPQRGTPDWSVWQPCKVEKKRPVWEIDSQGFEVEYQALYTHPHPKREPLTEDERQDVYAKAIKAIDNDPHLSWRDAIVFETERAHKIGGEA